MRAGPGGLGQDLRPGCRRPAWEDAGFRLLGAVVQGTATEVLRDATAMECSTVASLLYRLDNDLVALDERSVVIVDESSTLGNRDLARLATYVDRAGAALRLVGDPAQHAAVAAGGGCRRCYRVVEADSPEELLDALAADWYVDRLHRRANPG